MVLTDFAFGHALIRWFAAHTPRAYLCRRSVAQSACFHASWPAVALPQPVGRRLQNGQGGADAVGSTEPQARDVSLCALPPRIAVAKPLAEAAVPLQLRSGPEPLRGTLASLLPGSSSSNHVAPVARAGRGRGGPANATGEAARPERAGACRGSRLY
jgi:hypothetical protein